MDREYFYDQPEFASSATADAPGEETLVTDARAHLSPAQLVERKLMTMLPGIPLPLSQVQTSRPARSL